MDEHPLLAKFTKLDFLRPNPLGRLLFSIYKPPIAELYKRRIRGEVHITATQCLLAMAADKRDHNALPADLPQLSPRYLKTLPVDPISGNLFGYSREKKIIYSVGFDMTDDGGDDTPEVENRSGRWRSKDAVFEIGF